MKSYIQLCKNISLNVPANMLSGVGIIVDSISSVDNCDALTCKPAILSAVGVFDLQQTTDTSVIEDTAYWYCANDGLIEKVTDNTWRGVAIAASWAGATTVRFSLSDRS